CIHTLFSYLCWLPPRPILFPYTTLFRSTRPSPRRACTRAGWTPTPRFVGTAVLPTSGQVTASAHPARSHSRVESGAMIRMPSSRSEEHTSELQSRENLVCSLLLEKKNSS